MNLRAEISALHPENLDAGTWLRLRSRLMDVLRDSAEFEMESATTSEMLAHVSELLEESRGRRSDP